MIRKKLLEELEKLSKKHKIEDFAFIYQRKGDIIRVAFNCTDDFKNKVLKIIKTPTKED